MKKILFILPIILFMGFIACEEDGAPIFVAKQSEEGVSFSNTFSSVYLITEDTEDNIAERFVWNAVDFGAPVNITYELQGSIDPEFATFEVVGSTSENNIAISVSRLLEFAVDMGLDDDPTTTNDAGSPNNTGQVYFRLRAFAGSGTANTVESISAIQALTISWIEKSLDAGCASIYAVGDGLVNVGWVWSSPAEFFCDGDIFTGRVELTNNAFRFFTESGNWDSGLNYPYYVGEGYTIDADLIDAQDNDNNFQFVGTPGIYELVVNDIDKTITLNPSMPYYIVGDAVPGNWSFAGAVTASEDSPYIRSATLNFTNGIFRFFTEVDNWNSGLNFPYYEDLEYTIDDRFEDDGGGDSNFRFTGTPGTYTITINDKDKTITLQ